MKPDTTPHHSSRNFALNRRRHARNGGLAASLCSTCGGELWFDHLETRINDYVEIFVCCICGLEQSTIDVTRQGQADMPTGPTSTRLHRP